MTVDNRKGIYRANTAAPSENIPLGARSVGHYIISPGNNEIPIVKKFVQIFWGIKGNGTLIINELERKLYPGQLAIYFPGMEHNLQANCEWEYRWWTMDGPLATSITAGFGLVRADIYEAGPAPVEIFEELEKAISENTPAGERKASAIAYKLLSYAAGYRPSEINSDIKIKHAIDIIHKEWNKAGFGVESLSEKLKMDRSVLSRRFHAATGIAPMNYVNNLRIQNALSLLKNGNEKISVIARNCGWSDPNYFSRSIKKATGVSPEEFRKQ